MPSRPAMCAMWVCLSAPPFAWAGEPTVRSLSVRGLQVGGTTTIVVDGDELGAAPKLLLPFAANQTLIPKSSNTRASFEVALPPDVTPGYHQLRVVTDGGVSPAVVIGVDRLPQVPFAATATVPAALHGSVGGSQVAETAFAGKAGQKLTVEVEAQRLGSKLRPVAHLYGPKKLQLAWSWPTTALRGDTRFEATLPDDGTYTVTVHDLEYAAPGAGFFRLKFGQWNGVDQVFPPVVGTGTRAVELLGSGPAVRADVPAAAGPVVPLAWPKDGVWSGPRPFVEVGSRPELLEQRATGTPQELPAAPVAVSGRLAAPFEADGYRLPVTPGEKLRLEVFAERLGSPVDAALAVRNDAGADLARVEDAPGTLDPVLEYTVPAGVTAVTVAVIDALGRGGPRGVYRLTADPVTTSSGRAEFELTTPTGRLSVPVGGRAVVPVYAERKGFAGRIDLTADGLPAGTKLGNATIPPDADGTLVSVTQSAAGPAAITTWRGRGENGVVRPVFVHNHPLKQLQPWLADEFAVAPAARPSWFAVEWQDPAAPAVLSPTGRLPLPVRVTRPGAESVVRLTLLTSQPPQTTNGQPDPAKTLRLASAIEYAGKAPPAPPTVAVPAELPADGYDIAIQADLLTSNRQTVLATGFTPVRRFAVRLPVAVKLDGPASVSATRDPKGPVTAEVAGQVVRTEEVTGDAVVSLAGLPPGFAAAPVTVKPGETKFTVKVTLPAGQPAGDVTGLNLSATAAPDPKQPGVRVKSREVGVSLAVPPPPAPPKK